MTTLKTTAGNITARTKSKDRYFYKYEEPVIYLPDDPEKHRIVKDLDVPPTFDAQGNHLVDKRISLLLTCIIPAAVVIENFYFLILTFF